MMTTSQAAGTFSSWRIFPRVLCVLGLLIAASWGLSACSDEGDDDPNAGNGAPPKDVSFGTEVQPILTGSCASFPQCHDSSAPVGSMDLTVGNAYGNTVGVDASNTYPDEVRVVESDTSESLLYQKLIGTDFGAKMPLSPGAITQRQIDTIRVWIEEGAKNN